MKKLVSRIFSLGVLCGLMALVACGGNTSKKTSSTEETRTEAQSVMSVDDLLKALSATEGESLVGKTVTFEGVCTHTCKHGARKIFLMGSDDTQTIRVESGELGHFDPQCVNHVVKITGKVEEQRVDESYLTQWEQQAAAQTAENHGKGEAGCDAEKNARQETGNTTAERIAAFRERIAARKASEGKDYLSFYFVTAESYEIE